MRYRNVSVCISSYLKTIKCEKTINEIKGDSDCNYLLFKRFICLFILINILMILVSIDLSIDLDRMPF